MQIRVYLVNWDLPWEPAELGFRLAFGVGPENLYNQMITIKLTLIIPGFFNKISNSRREKLKTVKTQTKIGSTT